MIFFKRVMFSYLLLVSFGGKSQVYSPDNKPLKNYEPLPPTVIWRSQIAKGNISGNPKPVIDSNGIKHWITMDHGKERISNDGKYFAYSVRNQPYQSNTLVITATNGSWKKELVGVSEGFFSGNNKEFIYLFENKLHFIKLSTEKEQIITNVTEYSTPVEGKWEWLCYKINEDSKKVILRNLLTGKEYIFVDVVNYSFDGNGSIMLLEKAINNGKSTISLLQWVSLAEMSITDVWYSENNQKLINYYLDALHQQLAFIVSDFSQEPKKSNCSIWYYKFGSKKAIMAVNNKMRGIEKGLEIRESSSPAFTKDGRYLCFDLIDKKEHVVKNPDAVQLDVWSYSDSILQSVQLEKIANGETFENRNTSVIAIDDISSPEKQVISLTKNDESSAIGIREIAGDFFITKKDLGGDKFWVQANEYWIVSLKDGSRRFLKKIERKSDPGVWLSPGGRYVLLFNSDRQYESYDLQTADRKIISNKSNRPWNIQSIYDRNYNSPFPEGIVGWVGNDVGVIVYDDFDIWQIDLSGKQSPISITSEYGRRHNLKIRLVDENKQWKIGDRLLLTAFDPLNKNNGLYHITLGIKKNTEEPILGPWCLYYRQDVIQAAAGDAFERIGLMKPIKAKHVDTWIVRRQTATEFSNYYFTHDFKTYQPITKLQPHKEINWVTTELLQWQLPDGITGQGILYKPENFDSSKKYPLLIYYYTQFSGRLHQYPIPEFTRSMHINIAWFVSHGYLVFTPDMYYVKNRIVESVCNTIVSAAESLAQLPYIDRKKMGISGFSWGGGQTNWLITQTNIFAAAATGGAASADLVSLALQIEESRGKKRQNRMQSIEDLIGATLWERPDLWLDVSAVHHAHKITCPVLMMNNYGEGVWQSFTELYIAMRRLNKKVWMLQYDNGSHGLGVGKEAEDFTIRITQFFDHLLKGMPPPRWMSRGIPAQLKGAEMGYDIDSAQLAQ